MTNAFLGRQITTDLELTVWDPPREFRYRGTRSEGPPLDNWRVFEPVPGGTQLIGTTETEVRPGLAGLVDRVKMRAIQRMHAKAMRRLPEVVGKTPRTTSG